jgi:hypothetical protein
VMPPQAPSAAHRPRPKDQTIANPVSPFPTLVKTPAPQSVSNYIDGRIEPLSRDDQHAQPRPTEKDVLSLEEPEPITPVRRTEAGTSVDRERQVRAPQRPPLLEADVPTEESERRLQAALRLEKRQPAATPYSHTPARVEAKPAPVPTSAPDSPPIFTW